MKKPKKKDDYFLYPDNEYPKGYNDALTLSEKYHAWDIKKNYIHKDKLSVEKIAELLHTAGLHAYRDYKSMGKSGEMWRDFRIQLATELSNQLK